jgi:hypothetical protein
VEEGHLKEARARISARRRTTAEGVGPLTNVSPTKRV